MGIYRPFIGGVKTLEQSQEVDHSNDKPFTPADIMTVARPILAIKVADMLIKGEKGVFPVVAVMGMTDMEGKLARVIDKTWPDSGWGSTAHGAPADTVADTMALLIVGGATLRAPRVTRTAKFAMAAVLGQEGAKTAWALTANHAYRDISGENLILPASLEGKEAMAEKLSAAGLAVATNDTDSAFLRTGLSIAAAGFAGVGALRGERARVAYEPMVQELMHEASLLNPTT